METKTGDVPTPTEKYICFSANEPMPHPRDFVPGKLRCTLSTAHALDIIEIAAHWFDCVMEPPVHPGVYILRDLRFRTPSFIQVCWTGSKWTGAVYPDGRHQYYIHGSDLACMQWCGLPEELAREHGTYVEGANHVA